MHYVRILRALPCPHVTHYYVISYKCCYTCGNMLLHTFFPMYSCHSVMHHQYCFVDASMSAQIAHLMLKTQFPLFSLSPNTDPFSFISIDVASSHDMVPRYHLPVLYTELDDMIWQVTCLARVTGSVLVNECSWFSDKLGDVVKCAMLAPTCTCSIAQMSRLHCYQGQ